MVQVKIINHISDKASKGLAVRHSGWSQTFRAHIQAEPELFQLIKLRLVNNTIGVDVTPILLL